MTYSYWNLQFCYLIFLCLRRIYGGDIVFKDLKTEYVVMMRLRYDFQNVGFYINNQRVESCYFIWFIRLV